MACASNNPQSLFNVFVYGSLLHEDVVRALLKRLPPSSPALLHNFHRFSIKGCVYPAILPVENKKVNGKRFSVARKFSLSVTKIGIGKVKFSKSQLTLQVLSGITVPELDILDKFEDVEYERRTVDVSLTDSSNTLMVEAYVWADQSDPNLYGEWDFEEWERLHKQGFLKMTMEFLEELDKPDQSGST